MPNKKIPPRKIAQSVSKRPLQTPVKTSKKNFSALNKPADETLSYLQNFFLRRGFSRKEGSYSAAIILILIGFIVLFNNFGLIPWSIWAFVWRFWPLALIIWGLQVVLGDSRLSRIVMVIVTFFTVFYVISVAVAQNNPQFRDYLNSRFPGWDISAQYYSNYDYPVMDEFELDE